MADSISHVQVASVTAVTIFVVAATIYLWHHSNLAHSPSASRLPPKLRPEPQPRDEPVQLKQNQDVQLGHASLSDVSNGQTEVSFQDGSKATGRQADQHYRPKGQTFRVRGVPKDWDIERLQSALSDQDRSAGPTVSSLAPEMHGRSQTATIAFQNTPSELQHLKPEQSLHVPLPVPPYQAAGSQGLALDDGFLGITTLYAPLPQDHRVDIIAISGLGGHAFGSFKERGGEHMWLRDALPYHISQDDGKPYARVMVYGYESSLPQSQCIQNLEDLAISFRSSLLGLVSTAVSKPIIFIAHSLGGLIVKQALILLSKSTKEEDRKLLEAVYGIVFFGVPHDGMDISSLIPMVEDNENRFLLESIGNINSQILSIQQRDFHRALGSEGESEIVCFYETLKSPTAVQIAGRWKMEGPPAVLVTKASATHWRPWEDGAEHSCAIRRTHSGMVKFGPQDDEYENARTLIKGLANRALAIRLPDLSRSAQDCLQSLAFREMDARSHDIDHAFKGTCRWLPEHEQYKEWAATPRGLLWIKGKPGSGKSTSLKYVFKHVTETPKIAGRALVLSFFLHGRGEPLQRTLLGLFRSLLHQILRQVPGTLSGLVDTFERRLKEKGEPGEKWEWHPNELWDFFEASLPRILETRSIWLFIDALDEAGDKEARDLVHRFKLLLERLPPTRLPFRICFACRHYPILEPDCQFIISPEKENREDISTYVRTRLSTSLGLRTSTIPDLITKRANGVFMWARLVVEQALNSHNEGDRLEATEAIIKSIHPELGALYGQLIKGMKKPTCLRLIQWICFATRPLSLDELRWAIVVHADCPHKSLEECEKEEDFAPNNETMERRLKALSCGLAEVVSSKDGKIVQFIHQSVRDYFVDNGLATLTAILASARTETSDIDGTGLAHSQICRTCIRYLAMHEIGRYLHGDHVLLTINKISSGMFNNNNVAQPLKKKFPLLHYATTSWIHHAKESDARRVSQDDLLSHFAGPSNTLMQLWVQVNWIIVPYATRIIPKETLFIHVVSRYNLLGPLGRILQSERQAVDIEAKDGYGQTPLSCAAENGHKDTVCLLLEKGANIETTDNKYGQTPLSWAATNGHKGTVRILIEKGANIETKDLNGQTPLSLAADSGREGTVRLLIEKGANIETKDIYSYLANKKRN